MTGHAAGEARVGASRAAMAVALTMVAAVWVLGAVWSFTEQTAFAAAKGYAAVAALLPLVIDGFAVSCAGVAFAASLDGRPAVPARLGTALGVLSSAASNGWWAAERSLSDPATVVIGIAVPVFANVAFEVLLAELRRQVQRARGLPAPAPLPTLRLTRLVLAPPSTFTAWRREVLARTEIRALANPRSRPAADDDPGRGGGVPSGLDQHPGGDPTRDPIEPPALTVKGPASGTAAVVGPCAASSVGTAAPISGTTPSGVIPSGAAPSGVAPSGVAPSGVDSASMPAQPVTDEGSGRSRRVDGDRSDLEAGAAGVVSVGGGAASDPVSAEPAYGATGDAAVPGAGRGEGGAGGERNERVWRLARAMLDDARERGVAGRDDDGGIVEDDWSGSRAATVLGGSRRNGQRLVARAATLARALQHHEPPTPPDGIDLGPNPGPSPEASPDVVEATVGRAVADRAAVAGDRPSAVAGGDHPRAGEDSKNSEGKARVGQAGPDTTEPTAGTARPAPRTTSPELRVVGST